MSDIEASETTVTSEAKAPSCAADHFDFCARLSGPSNMSQLADMMKARNIANDANVEFSEEFVEQFYDDASQTPGNQCMFNGEPSVWGEKIWDLLHLIPYYYPAYPSDDVKRAAYQNIHSLRFLLPCEHCRRGFRKEILETPVEEYLESRETFLEWSIELHSSVNKRLGKPPFDTDATFKRLLAREHLATQTTTVSGAAKQNTKKEPHESKRRAVKTVQKAVEPDTQIVQRRNILKNPMTVQAETIGATTASAAVASTGNNGGASNSHDAVPKTNYGVVSQRVTANESLQSVRDAIRRNGQLTLQQKANLQKLQRAQQAKGIKEPAECKSCGGKNKPKTPSVF